MKLKIDVVYVMHYHPLRERLEHIKQLMLKNKINFLIFDMEPESEEEIKKYFLDDLKVRIEKFLPFTDNPPYRQIKKSEISLAYKHLKALENMVENDYQTALFLEDDIILCENFSEIANNFISKTPNDWDLIFPGNGCNLRISKNLIENGKVAYKKDHPATKCTDSYFIKLEAAKKLLKTIKPFHVPIDWELNYQLLQHDMNVYWFEPPITQQGSAGPGLGIWESSIQ